MAVLDNSPAARVWVRKDCMEIVRCATTLWVPLLKESATIMVQEAIKLLYTLQGSEQKQQKSPSGSEAHRVITNYLLKFDAWNPLLFSSID